MIVVLISLAGSSSESCAHRPSGSLPLVAVMVWVVAVESEAANRSEVASHFIDAGMTTFTVARPGSPMAYTAKLA